MQSAPSKERPTIEAEATDYTTRSHDVACCLVCNGFELKGYQGDRNRPIYVFNDPDGELAFACQMGTMNFSITDGRKLLEISRNLYRELDSCLGPRKRRNDQNGPSNPPRGER